MDKIKDKLTSITKTLNLKELKILPAYLSYNLVLAIIPTLTIIACIASLFSISIDSVISLIRSFIPETIGNYIISAISGKEFDFTVGVLSLATFGVATNGTYAIINASNSLYKVEDKDRSYFKERLKAIFMLFILIGLVIFLILVPILGEKIITLLNKYQTLSNVFEEIILIFKAIKWPLTFLIIFFTIKIIYIIAPSVKVEQESTTIGSLIATISFVIFTAIFSYYIKYFGKYDLIYGGLSSIIVLLIWIYALSFILLLGIVINTSKYNKITKSQ